MCLDIKVDVNIPKVLAFKIMERTNKGFRPIFEMPRALDDRVFKMREVYEAKGKVWGGGGSFSGNTSFVDVVALYKLFKSNNFWTWSVSRSLAPNLCVVLVELSGDLQREGEIKLQDNFGQCHVQGKFMKILSVVPKNQLT